MAYNSHGKRIRSENLAGQVTTTAWYDWSVTYNGENRPVLWTLINPFTPNSSTPTLLSMSYDRMGRRVTKNNQRFIYNGYLQIADNNGNAYVWDPTEKVATRPLVWNSSTIQPFNFSTSYYVHDGNKNVSDVVAESGDVTAHYEYAPFGAVTMQSGNSSAANPWRFSCEYAEDDTATAYYNYRHYEPVMGRWLSRDPYFRAQYMNSYLMCLNETPNLFDGLGLWSSVIIETHQNMVRKAVKRAPTGSDLIATVNYHSSGSL